MDIRDFFIKKGCNESIKKLIKTPRGRVNDSKKQLSIKLYLVKINK